MHAAAARDRVRAGRRPVAQGQGRARAAPGSPGASSPRSAAATGREALEAPFVGRDDELRMLKDLYHATVRERPATPGVGHRAGGHRQEPPRLGVQQVHRRPRRGRCGGTQGRSPAYGEGITLLGAGRDGPRPRAGCSRPTTSRPRAPRSRRTVARVRPRRGASGAGSSRRCWRCWASETRHGGSRAAVRGLAHVLRADGRVRTRWSWCSRTSTGRTAARSTSSTTCSTGARSVPIFVVTLARPELLERRPDWGAGKRQFTSLFLEPLPEAAMRRAPRGPRARAAGGGRAGASWRARTACPLYAVETVRMLVAEGRLVAARTASISPIGDLTTLAVPETPDGAHRGAPRCARPGRPLAHPGRGRCSARASRRRRSRRSAAPSQAQLDAAAAGLVRRELLVQEADPRSPERGPVRVRPGAHPRGRLRHARATRPQGAPPGRGPLVRVAGSRRAGGRARGPLPRGPRQCVG